MPDTLPDGIADAVGLSKVHKFKFTVVKAQADVKGKRLS
jgi:hypothetical protein